MVACTSVTGSGSAIRDLYPGRELPVCRQVRAGLRGREGLGEEISLREPAAQRPQLRHLVAALDALGDDPHPEGVAQPDNAPDDLPILDRVAQIGDEAAID